MTPAPSVESPPPARRIHPVLRAVAAVLLGATLASLGWITFGPFIPKGPTGSLEWPRARPEATGLDADRLQALSNHLARNGTVAFLVIRGGWIVHERYAWGRGPWRPQSAASLTKSLVGSLATLVAADRGWLDLDEPVARYVEPWRNDPVRSRITFRHLLSHSSGIPNGREGSRVEPWAVPFWTLQEDLLEATLERAPVVTPPGSTSVYSGPAYAALAYALAQVLRDKECPSAAAIVRNHVQAPLGIPPQAWLAHGSPTFAARGVQVHSIWNGTALTARAAARVGGMMMLRGRYVSATILDSTLAHEAVSPALPTHSLAAAGSVPAAGLGWWSNAHRAWPELPSDAFVGTGNGGQILLVVPSLELVLVRFGNGMDAISMAPRFWEQLHEELIRPLARCVRPDPTHVGPRWGESHQATSGIRVVPLASG
jgi:CubicO group peptidase (beta-lactamase class C family)